MITTSTLSLSFFDEEGTRYVSIGFAYNKLLIDLAKGLGALWHAERRVWYLVYTQEIIAEIWDAYRGKIWINAEGLKGIARTPVASFQDRVNASKRASKKVKEEHRYYLEEFEKFLRARRYSASTISTYTSMIGIFTGFCEALPHEVSQLDLLNFEAGHMKKNNFSIATHRQFLGALKLYLQLFPNPAIDPGAIKSPKKDRHLPIVLSHEEIRRILESIYNLKHRTILVLIYSAGLRVGEAVRMRVSDVDFSRMQLYIQNGKGRKWRYVGLSEFAAIMIDNYLKSYQPEEFLFEGQLGGAYTANSVRKLLKDACIRAGIKKRVTPHTLRHSYATHLIESGVGLRHVQELLGHSKPETTMLYTHISRAQLVRIESPFDNLIRLGGLGGYFGLPEPKK